MANSHKTLVADAQNPNYILTPQINQYLLDHGNDAVRPDIMARIAEELTKPGRDRSGTFSASSSGMCLRRQEFGYLGKPEDKIVYPALQHVFMLGTWVGMQWAAMLLQAGLIEDIEIPLPWPKYRSQGSADGRGYVHWETINPAWRGREFVWENKTVGSHVYAKYVDLGIPQPKHMMQIHRYMVVSGIDLAVVTYVDKGNSGNDGWHEFVVEADPKLLDASKRELEELNSAVDNKQLHDLLPECKIGIGEFLKCPFGGKDGICRTTKRWG